MSSQKNKFGLFPNPVINENVHWKKDPIPLKMSVIFIVVIFRFVTLKSTNYIQKEEEIDKKGFRIAKKRLNLGKSPKIIKNHLILGTERYVNTLV